MSKFQALQIVMMGLPKPSDDNPIMDAYLNPTNPAPDKCEHGISWDDPCEDCRADTE